MGYGLVPHWGVFAPGLAVDYHNERLYWADAKLSVIGSIRLNGTDPVVAIDNKKGEQHPESPWSSREEADLAKVDIPGLGVPRGSLGAHDLACDLAWEEDNPLASPPCTGWEALAQNPSSLSKAATGQLCCQLLSHL